ncbi:hypothetical protein ACHAWU_006021 [Discostella pseudostelligera]|uniref:Uncharacterized protein n=1 Tax=Discostella pseudostelligera TaxID=259834 RepID=A0ABD3M0T0_9STRA
MATMNHILIFFVSLIFITTLATNLVFASSSSSSSASVVEIEIDPNSAAAAAASATSGTDRMIRPTFPEHWGPPPKIQTRDYVQLPGDYGRGSGTLRNWILKKMEEDAQQQQQEQAVAVETEREVEVEASSSAKTLSSASWTEKDMVGWSGEDAKVAILAEQPTLHVFILPENSMLTMDYSEERVRIIVDENGKVVRQPRVG